VSERKTKSYADVLKYPIKVGDNKREKQNVPHKTNLPHKDSIKNTFPSIWNHTIMYQSSFLGYCYSCNGFVHKDIDCIINEKHCYMRNNNIYAYEFSRRNYNSFSPLLNHNIICYNCNNYAHIAKLRRSDFRKKQKEGTPTIIERTQEQKE
jgi:hypothetical protein